MKSRSRPRLDSWKRVPLAAAGVWANQAVTVNLIGTDAPAETIALDLVRKGVALQIYDPRRLEQPKGRSPAAAYRALALIQRLAQVPGNPQCRMVGYPFQFDAVNAFPCDLAIMINPDYGLWRFCADYFAETPYVAVTTDVQDKVGYVLPCLGSHGKGLRTTFSRDVALGTTDVCTRALALVGEAVDSLLVGREVPWSVAQVWSTDAQGWWTNRADTDTNNAAPVTSTRKMKIIAPALSR